MTRRREPALWAVALLPLVVGTPAPAPLASVNAAALVDVMRFGAKGDGVTDDTAAFRAAAATGKGLRIPKPRAHYRLTGRVDVHGSVVGEGMPEIRMYGATGSRDHAQTVFALDGYDGPGVVFRGLHLNGQWDGVGTDGEWSHLIQIRASRNVTVEDNVLERPYGDCIYVGSRRGEGDGGRNVVVRNNTLRDPRRCAVAVVAGEGVTIARNRIEKRLDYVAAIDLEPDPETRDAVQGVVIEDNDFDVAGAAVMLYTRPQNLPCGPVTVRGNRGTANRFVLKMEGTGRWQGLAIARNRYGGAGARGGLQSFVAIVGAEEVRIEENRIALSGRDAPRGSGDLLRGVRGLRLADNEWSADRSYPITVEGCPDARLERNRFSGARTELRP
jgi:hypothetical protein